MRCLPIIRLTLAWWACLDLSQAQYVPKSQGLTDNTAAITFVKESADFWKASKDSVKGGFFTDVNQMGQATGTRKSILTQSRHAFGFAKAFMLTGDETYLDLARHALDFQYAHFWDSANDGWFVVTDEDGVPLSGNGSNNTKWSFFQDYALLGPATLILAADQSVDRNWLALGTAANLMRWDSRSGFEGYYKDASADFSTLSGKGFLPTVDALNTYLIRRYQISGSAADLDHAFQLGDQIVNHLVGNMDDPSVAFGFPEEFDQDWQIDTNETQVSTGHMLKTAWMLGELHLISPNSSYLAAMREIIDEVLDYDLVGHEAWDATNGGPFSYFDWDSGEREHSNKEWWMVEQAFNAAILAYYFTEEDKYLQMADESLAFFEEHFVDETYKEVFAVTSETGTPQSTNKGDFWKAGFHSTELGWFTYLYGQLFYHLRPVTLHYRCEASASGSSHTLNPLAIAESRLSIQSVSHAGLDFTTFDPVSRRLDLPPNIGGVFAVTFGLDRIPVQDIDTDGLPDAFEQTYFGSATAANPDADTDGDGATEHAEWLFGTHPNNGQASPGQSFNHQITGSQISMSIATVTDRRYWLEGSNDLINYVRISDRRVGTGNVMTFTDNVVGRQFRAYQIRVSN